MTLTLSTVTPVYSGACYLEELTQELSTLREKWVANNVPITLAEAIFVNDSSIDDSYQVLERINSKYSWVTVLNLSRNFGQHPATVAGILHSSGDWIVTLDEDLQHRPDQIENLIRKAVKESYDIVYACPKEAVHENLIRDLGSRFYKKLMTILTGNKEIRSFNSFRLMRGSIARAASSVCSHDMYFDTVLSWFTQRVGSVNLMLKDNRLIKGGKSGYNFRKLLSHARRMLVSTHTKALRFGALVGLSSLLISVFYGIYVIFLKLIMPSALIHGLASLVIITLFFGGVISFLIGVLLEYMVVILLHIQGKPTFFVVDRKSDLILAQYFAKENS